VPAPNRVTPEGEIVALAQRGLFLGNRGCIHDGPGHLARRWQVRRWITCALRYKDWRAPMWEPRRWTPLFFWDEAVALAAGHRPCALCRHRDYVAWCDAWEAATGSRLGADAMDRVLHADRLDGRVQRHHVRPWRLLPAGTFVAAGGDGPALVLPDRLVPWSPDGYGEAVARPSRGDAIVLTPAVTVRLLEAGYDPVIHPGVGT
jgi:hypothetical protein